MRRRPEISLRGPHVLVPGRSFDLTVELDVPRELKIESVTIRLTGVEETTVGGGTDVYAYQTTVCAAARTLAEATTLPPGLHSLPARFTIPPSAPPSYYSPRTRVHYEVQVDVDASRWSNAQQRFHLHVARSRPGPEPPGRLVSFVYPPGGPLVDEPAFDGSLAGTVLVPGGRLEGRLAFHNVASNRYRGFAVALVGVERRTMPSVGAEASVVARHQTDHSTPAPIEGGEMAFVLQVPNVPPSTVSHLFRLDWHVEVQVDAAWSSIHHVQIPVIVTSPTASRASATARPARALPSVGSPRIAKVWQSVAEELRLANVNGALRGRIGDVEVQLTREHVGGRGNHLVASLAFPSLHLGLRTSVRGLDGRDHKQVRAFAAMLPVLSRSEGLSLSDEEARIERKDSGQHRERLAAFARSALAMAAAIARGRPHLPPPTSEVERLPAWIELARRLDGTLERGRLAVQGTLRGIRVEVVPRWGPRGAPLGVRLSLRPPVKPTVTTPPAWDGDGELTITDDEIALELPPPADPLALLDRLAKLRELAERLAPRSAYR